MLFDVVDEEGTHLFKTVETVTTRSSLKDHTHADISLIEGIFASVRDTLTRYFNVLVLFGGGDFFKVLVQLIVVLFLVFVLLS